MRLFGLALQLVEGLVDRLALLLGLRGVLADLEVDLFAKDRHRARRLDPDPDLFAHDREHRHLDVITDHDALVGLSGENQHRASGQPYIAPRPVVKANEACSQGILSYTHSRGGRKPLPTGGRNSAGSL